MDFQAYRAGAEAFVGELGLEYYRHYAGHTDELEIEAVYERHDSLFSRSVVEELRHAHEDARAEELGGEQARRHRCLLEFCLEGHLGQATRSLDAELARREARLRLDVDHEGVGFRESLILQANEPAGARRARLEAARLHAVEEHLNPLHTEALELTHSLARELGWASYRALWEDVKAIDFSALQRQTAAFLAATERSYPAVVDPALRFTCDVGLNEARRSDLPRFFRLAQADAVFPAHRLVASFRETMAGLGIHLDAQRNVILDLERRATKSPRAFCAPVRVPDEVYLVVPRLGGRDDYVALFHEGGHTQHYAWVAPDLPFEFRHLGDNSVTEGFAFLFDRLLENPEWLRRRLGVDGKGLAPHLRAQRMVLLRRYAAKFAYELELHGDVALPPSVQADSYTAHLSAAVGLSWPRATFLADLDRGFYSANYLRAWALETHVRTALRSRFGPAWFDEPAAGELLRSHWRQGQRLDADELVDQLGGGELDFSTLGADLGLVAA